MVGFWLKYGAVIFIFFGEVFAFLSKCFLYLMYDCRTFFLVLSDKNLVLRSNSSARSVVGAILGLNCSLGLCSRMLCGTLPLNTRLDSQSIGDW